MKFKIGAEQLGGWQEFSHVLQPDPHALFLEDLSSHLREGRQMLDLIPTYADEVELAKNYAQPTEALTRVREWEEEVYWFLHAHDPDGQVLAERFRDDSDAPEDEKPDPAVFHPLGSAETTKMLKRRLRRLSQLADEIRGQPRRAA